MLRLNRLCNCLDYLSLDDAVLADIRPDLILVASGIQRRLGLRLAERGLPVYALPLPGSFYGVLGNIITTATLMDATAEGRGLCHDLTAKAAQLRAAAPTPRPSVYVELWLGRHARAPGGRSYVSDVIEMAGGDPLYGASAMAYMDLPLADVAARRPRAVLGFSEPEYPVDFPAMLRDRGWTDAFAPALVTSTVARGRNVIHDGPSMLETASWLQEELCKALGGDQGRP